MDFEDLIPAQNKATGNAGDRGGIGFDDLVPAKSRGREVSVKPSRRRGTVQATGENAPRGMQNQKQAIIDYYNNSGIADLNREDAEQIFATLPEDVAGPVRDMWARDTVKSSRKENEKSTLGSIAQGVHDKAQQYLQYTPVGPFVDEITSYPNALMGADLDTELALSRAQKSAAYEGDENPLIRTPLGDIYGSGLAKVAGIPTNFLIPQAKVFQGGNALSRAGNAAATGAGLGAAMGFGEGSGASDRMINAGVSGAVGAGLGGGLTLAGSGAVAGAKKAGEGLSSLYRQYVQPSISGNINPSAAAAKNIQAAIQQDARVAQTAGADDVLTPAQFQQAQQQGQPVTLMELGGETTRSLARSAANNSPEARSILNAATNKRYETQGGRVRDFIDDLTTTPGKPVDEMLGEVSKARGPLYQKAYSEAAEGVMDGNLVRLEQSPVIKSAMKDAQTRLSDRFAAGADTGGKPPGTFEYAMPAGKTYTARTLEFWDATKQSLDDTVSALYRQGKKGRAREVDNIRKRLVEILDDNSPSYKQARGTAQTYFKSRDAYEAGQKFVRTKGSVKDAAKAIDSMTPPEQELFRKGYAESLTSKIENISDRRNVANMLLESPAARARAVTALGKERVKQLSTMLHVENLMQLSRSAVSGNSTTARQLAEMGLTYGVASTSAGYGAYTGDAKGYVFAAALLGGRGAANAGRRKIAEEVAKLLTSNNPQALQQAITKIAKSPDLSRRVRYLDKLFADKGIWKAAAVNSPKLTNSEEN